MTAYNNYNKITEQFDVTLNITICALQNNVKRKHQSCHIQSQTSVARVLRDVKTHHLCNVNQNVLPLSSIILFDKSSV
jgi:hypothetical protein